MFSKYILDFINKDIFILSKNKNVNEKQFNSEEIKVIINR